MSAIWWFLPVLCVIIWAGCDSQRADEDSLLRQGIPDTTLYAQDLPFVLDLTRYLAVDAGEIEYSVQEDGGAVLVERGSNVLTIRPLAVGKSTVTLTFPNHSATQESFDVEVRCATAMGPGRKGYFPHEIGQSWKYTYAHAQTTLSGYSTRFNGTQTWTVEEVVDTCESKTIRLGIVSKGNYLNFAAPSLSAVDTTMYDLATATLSARLVIIPRVTREGVGFEWVHAPVSPPVVHRETVWGTPANRVSYDIQQGVGIVRYEFRSAQIHQAFTSIYLELIRAP